MTYQGAPVSALTEQTTTSQGGVVMKVSRSIPKSVLAAFAALTVAAPVAGAVPIYDGHPPHRALQQGASYDVNRDTGAYTPADASVDMHASTVKPAFEKDVVAVDLRTEAAKSPIQSRLVTDDLPNGGDLRSEHAKAAPTKAPLPGPPAYPSPFPEAPVASPEPVQATDPDGGSFDWPLAGMIAGGAIALLGAALIAGRQARGHGRLAH